MTFSEVMLNAGVILKDAAKQAADEYIAEREHEAKNRQFENDIVCAIAALSDAGVKEDKLYDYLERFWSIDSRQEARYYIAKGRYFWWPLQKLRDHLCASGLSPQDFFRRYSVSAQLNEHPEWHSLSGEEIEKRVKTVK